MFYFYIPFLLVLPSFTCKSLPFITPEEGSIALPPITQDFLHKDSMCTLLLLWRSAKGRRGREGNTEEVSRLLTFS